VSGERADEDGRAGGGAQDGGAAQARKRGRPKKTVTQPERPGLGWGDPLAELPPVARSVLEAARRVLAERGLEGLTLEAVANEAGVSKNLIPYYFGSRAGLVTILFDSLFHDLAVGFHKRRAAEPRGVLSDYLEWIRQEAEYEPAQRDFFELIVVALREQELRKRIAVLYDDYRDLTLELSGVAGSDDPERQKRLRAVGTVLIAIADGLGLQAVLDPTMDLDEALRTVELVLREGIEKLAGGDG
jgi:AcrR family transcriptional regulator